MADARARRRVLVEASIRTGAEAQKICSARLLGPYRVPSHCRIWRSAPPGHIVRSRLYHEHCGEVDSRWLAPVLHARIGQPVLIRHTSALCDALRRAAVGSPPGGLRSVARSAASVIFAMASSMVKVFGFWTGGNSLKVSANFAAAGLRRVDEVGVVQEPVVVRVRRDVRELIRVGAQVEDLWHPQPVKGSAQTAIVPWHAAP